MPNRPIGVFDSGLGGISVLKEIHKQLPNEDLIYIADSAHTPYGDKDRQTILQRCRFVTQYFQEQDVKALVIACNTATAVAANTLRKEFPALEIIGLEPAVKPAAQLTKKKAIGILATEQTIKSQRLANLINEYASEIRTETQACSGLVEQVEAGEFSSDTTKKLLANYINPMLDKGIDTLVLGCTHYPFLSESIQQLTNGSVKILETSIPVTHQLKRILKNKQLMNHHRQGKIRFCSSEVSETHKNGVITLWQNTVEIEALPRQFC